MKIVMILVFKVLLNTWKAMAIAKMLIPKQARGFWKATYKWYTNGEKGALRGHTEYQ